MTEPLPGSAGPLDIAMDEARHDPAPNNPARVLLEKQSRLIDADLHLRGWQIASERAGFGLKLLTGLAGVALAAVVVWSVWDASRHQGLVVEAFSVPPDLAQRGVTGQAVAGQVLDELVRMQEATDSVRSASSYAIDWGDDFQIEIPQTGVSIGQAQRFLRQQFGRETRVSGTVMRRADGTLVVTGRAGGAAGRTVAGAEAEFDALVHRAAEQLYGATQPYRYAVYLGRHGRRAEAMAELRSRFDRGTVRDRGWARIGWAIQNLNAGGDVGATRASLLEADRLMPDHAIVQLDLAPYGEEIFGRSEASYQRDRRALALFRDEPADVSLDATRLFPSPSRRTSRVRNRTSGAPAPDQRPSCSRPM